MTSPPNDQEPLSTSTLSKDDMVGLAAGTLVTTPDGEKKIEEVKAGDLVLSGVGASETRFHEVTKVSAQPYCGLMLQVTAGNLPHLIKGNSARLRAGRSVRQFYVAPNHICFAFHRDLNRRGNAVILQAFDRGRQAFDTGERSGSIKHSICRVSEKEFDVYRRSSRA